MTMRDELGLREAYLNTYEKDIKLPENEPPGTEEELQSYFKMDRLTVEKLSYEACMSIGYRLAQYALYIQRCVNREKSVAMWANEEINRIIAKELLQYDQYTKHEIKVAAISRTNSAVMELVRIKNWANQRVCRLDEIAGGIRNLSYTISRVQKTKGE